MDAMAQILTLVALLLGFMQTTNADRCYEESELSKAANRKLASHYLQPNEPRVVVPHDAPYECPLDLYLHLWDLEDRSLSPWRYVSADEWFERRPHSGRPGLKSSRKSMKDHYPDTYVEAQCLCSGCIIVKNKGPPELNNDYNSVTVNQTRVFLKREPCSDKGMYYLKPVSVTVSVACTCATPRVVS
ncbi:interleukin-17C isoform X1 [Stigmatopora argus]